MKISVTAKAEITKIDELILNKLYKEKLKIVLEALLLNLKEYITEIWLFGSCARNDIKSGSDIDIMLISKIPSRKLSAMVDDLDIREDTGAIPIDITVRTENEINSKVYAFNDYVRKDKIVLWK